MLTLLVGVDQKAMAIRKYSEFPKAPNLLEPHHQFVLCHIQKTWWKSLTFQQRRSQFILHTQPTGPEDRKVTGEQIRRRKNQWHTNFDMSSKMIGRERTKIKSIYVALGWRRARIEIVVTLSPPALVTNRRIRLLALLLLTQSSTLEENPH